MLTRFCNGIQLISWVKETVLALLEFDLCHKTQETPFEGLDLGWFMKVFLSAVVLVLVSALSH